MSVYCNRQVFNPHLHQNCQWSMTWKVIGLDTSTVWMTCVHFYWLEDGKKDEVPMVLAQIMMMSSIFWRWLSKYTKYYLSKCFNAKKTQCETKNIKQKIGKTYQPPSAHRHLSSSRGTWAFSWICDGNHHRRWSKDKSSGEPSVQRVKTP